MKKLALFLLAFLMVVAGIFHTTRPTIAPKNEGGYSSAEGCGPSFIFPKE